MSDIAILLDNKNFVRLTKLV